MIKNIAIVGFGGRGHIYGGFARSYPDKFNLVAVADIAQHRRKDAQENYGAEVYEDYKEMLGKRYKLDLVIISTQDADHKEQALYTLECGYDILLEKPIAISEEDCLAISDCAKQNNRKVYVCHVLRYTPFYREIKEIIDSGALGEIVNIHASENVGYYHHAHSYVRGPWRNSTQSSPIILAKCCHDMDIIRYLMGEKCLSVNSCGGLFYFKKENMPNGATAYCTDCLHRHDCVWSATKIYFAEKSKWMASYFNQDSATDENIMKYLRHSSYDRCVFNCDNDVADHQSTIMRFENGKTATHTLTAFSKEIYRDIKIFGTKAELVGVMEDNYIEIRKFCGTTERIDIDKNLVSSGHSGGDTHMMEAIYKTLNGEQCKGVATLDVSVESHLMAFGAERSRKLNGETQEISF